MDIRFLGHACFELTDGNHTLLIDPFLSHNPKAAAKPDELNPTAILLTHGHQDHVLDAEDIAKRCDCPIIALTEIAGEYEEAGCKAINPNFGGTVEQEWGWVRVVPAWHTSTTPRGTVSPPAGLVISFGGKTVYHLGDTALFSDLALPGKRDKLDVAIIPIGGHFTMDRHDAVEAAKLVGAATVIPCHYDTFPPIETDAAAFKSDVEAAGAGSVVVLAPGETHTA